VAVRSSEGLGRTLLASERRKAQPAESPPNQGDKKPAPPDPEKALNCPVRSLLGATEIWNHAKEKK